MRLNTMRYYEVYLAAVWVNLNRLLDRPRPNPFANLVAGERLKKATEGES